MTDSPVNWSRLGTKGELGWTTAAAAAAKSLQLCPTLCDPIDSSPPGSPIPGILQARTLEWVAISFSSAWKWKVKVKSESEVAQSCATSSDPMDCSLPGSSVHGIFQARVLEWLAIAFSKDEPQSDPKPFFQENYFIFGMLIHVHTHTHTHTHTDTHTQNTED